VWEERSPVKKRMKSDTDPIIGGPRRPVVFLSYSHEDEEHALFRRMMIDLDSTPGIRYWIDRQEIRAGDSLMAKLEEGIDEADFFLLVISKNSARSRWATQEFFLAYNSQLRDQELKILPVRIDDVQLPPQVRDLVVLDLFRNYDHGLQMLLRTILQKKGESLAQFPIDQTYDRTTIITVSDLIGQKLVEYFARHPEEMRTMDRRKFEELIAEVFDGFGYEVELTQQTRDGGRDIIAVRRQEVETRYLIECKRPEPGTHIGVRPVRELFGVKADEKATKAILATTAYFSRDALLFFDRNRWELEPRDYDGIVEWVKMYRQSMPR